MSTPLKINLLANVEVPTQEQPEESQQTTKQTTVDQTTAQTTKPEETTTELNKTGYVSADGLRVRKEPTTDSEEIDSLSKNDKVKIDAKNNDVTTIPGATVKDFADLLGKEVIVKNAKGEVLSADAKLATGCVINDTYAVAVLGDVNGDGEVDTGDTFLLKLVILGQRTLNEQCFKDSSDINHDGSVDTGDAFVLKKQVLKISNITL